MHIKTGNTSMSKGKLKKVWRLATTYWIYTKLCGRRLLRLVQKKRKFLGLLIITALGLVGLWLVIHYWNSLAATPYGRESYSTTLRNVGLLFGGALALLLAFWRSRVADRQARTAQVDVLDQRYQKGIEELGNTSPTKRLGGIYELQRLADEYPSQYHVPIMRRFCAALRESNDGGDTNDESKIETEPPHVAPEIGDDVQALIDAVGSRSRAKVDLEGRVGFQLNLSHSDLRNASLSDANLASVPWLGLAGFSMMKLIRSGLRTNLQDAKLCSAKLEFAKLSGADLEGACLCDAWLLRTDLSGANLVDANLHRALFWGPILSGAKFSRNGQRPAKGIRQSDLDNCVADPTNLPDLTGVRDAVTNEPLCWSGGPLDDLPK